jgi:hypothetical protein
VTGPVQVLVVGFDGMHLTGEVMAELDRLRAAGTARLLDVLLVERAEDGTFETLAPPAGASADLGTAVTRLLGAPERDEVGEQPMEAGTWSLADAIPPGTTTAVALIEHLWATPLRDAITRAGGTPLEETWLHHDDVSRLERLLES